MATKKRDDDNDDDDYDSVDYEEKETAVDRNEFLLELLLFPFQSRPLPSRSLCCSRCCYPHLHFHLFSSLDRLFFFSLFG
jgi:hypothetical protein